MGNRACVIFFDRFHVSPTVYLHWHGNAVPMWLDQLKDRMEEESPGNAGMVVVDTSDFSWKAYGGYLADSDGRRP